LTVELYCLSVKHHQGCTTQGNWFKMCYSWPWCRHVIDDVWCVFTEATASSSESDSADENGKYSL